MWALTVSLSQNNSCKSWVKNTDTQNTHTHTHTHTHENASQVYPISWCKWGHKIRWAMEDFVHLRIFFLGGGGGTILTRHLRMCLSWVMPAGYTKIITILHIKAGPERLSCQNCYAFVVPSWPARLSCGQLRNALNCTKLSRTWKRVKKANVLSMYVNQLSTKPTKFDYTVHTQSTLP